MQVLIRAAERSRYNMSMDQADYKHILRERQKGWEHLAKLELEERRNTSIGERLRELDALVEFGRRIGIRRVWTDLPPTWETWQLVRERYARKHNKTPR